MIFRHGSLEEIVSDQGTEYCNQLIDLLEKQTGFKLKNQYLPPTVIMVWMRG